MTDRDDTPVDYVDPEQSFQTTHLAAADICRRLGRAAMVSNAVGNQQCGTLCSVGGPRWSIFEQ